jgi:hypothetical protein
MAIPENAQRFYEERICNTVLIGSVLANKLQLNFSSDDPNSGCGDIVDLTCKP